MATFGAVLDTCVLFPMPLADTLLLAAADGAYTFHWTDDLLQELERTMLRTGRTPVQATRRVTQIRHIFAESEVTGYRRLISALRLPDPDDRHVLAAAIRAKVERIVTFDLGHFPEATLSEYEIKAVHPDEFLIDLIDLFPAQTVDLMQKQVAMLKNPPLTLEDLLMKLEKNNSVPRFVAQVRQVVIQSQQSDAAHFPDEHAGVLDLDLQRDKRRRKRPRA